MEPRLAYLIGYWIGDGSISRNPSKNRPDATITPLYGNYDDLPRVKKSLKTLGFSYEERPYYKNICWRINPGLKFARTIKELGYTWPCGSYQKHLPVGWEDWSEEARRALTAGLIDSDGTVLIQTKKHIRGGPRYDTRSERLIKEIILLFKSLGMETSYFKAPNGQIQSTNHTIQVTRRSLHRFQRLIPLQKKKQERVDLLCELLTEYPLPKGVRQIGKRFYAYKWEEGRQMSLGAYPSIAAAEQATGI